MLTVEDIVEKFQHIQYEAAASSLFGTAAQETWLSRFVNNVAGHTVAAKPLSSEQSRIILKLARTHRTLLIGNGIAASSLDSLLALPRHRLEPYQSSSIPREVRYVGDNKLAFRFKYNDLIIQQIKTLRPRSQSHVDQYPFFNRQHRIWVISVTRDTVDDVISFISRNRFNFDSGVEEYLCLAVNSKNQSSSFVFDPESGAIIVNVCDNESLVSWVRAMLGGQPL